MPPPAVDVVQATALSAAADAAVGHAAATPAALSASGSAKAAPAVHAAADATADGPAGAAGVKQAPPCKSSPSQPRLTKQNGQPLGLPAEPSATGRAGDATKNMA